VSVSSTRTRDRRGAADTGELGSIGGKNFLHGFTASMALFDRRRPGRSPKLAPRLTTKPAQASRSSRHCSTRR
jgi:hypothetical protein